MSQKKQVWIVGMGSGQIRFLTRQAAAAIQAADLLTGPGRLLSVFEEDRNHPKKYADTPEEIRRIIEETSAERAAVLVPWDTSEGFGNEVYTALAGFRPAIIPGISRQAYLMSRTGVSSENAVVWNPADKKKTLRMLLHEYERVFFCGGRVMKENLPVLLRSGFEEMAVCYIENPGERDEYAFRGKLENLRGRGFSENSLFLLQQTSPVGSERTGSYDEGTGDRDARLPEEVRVLALHAMKISRKAVIYDIGSGSGRLALDAAQMASDGFVYAIEKNEQLISGARERQIRAGIGNIRFIPGAAPDALAHLPLPDVVLLEGTDGAIKELLQIAISRNPFVRVVCIRGTVEGASEAVRLMEGMHFQPKMTELTFVRTRKSDGRHRLEPQLPYYLIAGEHRVRGSR